MRLEIWTGWRLGAGVDAWRLKNPLSGVLGVGIGTTIAPCAADTAPMHRE